MKKLNKDQKILVDGLRLCGVDIRIVNGLINFFRDDHDIIELTLFIALYAERTGNMPDQQMVIEAVARKLKGEDILKYV